MRFIANLRWYQTESCVLEEGRLYCDRYFDFTSTKQIVLGWAANSVRNVDAESWQIAKLPSAGARIHDQSQHFKLLASTFLTQSTAHPSKAWMKLNVLARANSAQLLPRRPLPKRTGASGGAKNEWRPKTNFIRDARKRRWIRGKMHSHLWSSLQPARCILTFRPEGCQLAKVYALHKAPRWHPISPL